MVFVICGLILSVYGIKALWGACARIGKSGVRGMNRFFDWIDEKIG